MTGPFANGDTNVRRDAPIRLTFSEPMRTSPVTAASISLTGSTRVTLAWSTDQKTLTVTPEAPITPPQSLTLSLRASDFQDAAGNALSGSTPTQWQWAVPTFLTEWATPKIGDGTAARSALALDRWGARSSPGPRPPAPRAPPRCMWRARTRAAPRSSAGA